MAETNIEWTTTVGINGALHPGFTFNPWWGCEKVSPGCRACYAEAFDHRLGGDHWGPGHPYKLNSAKYWAEPLRWNRKAEKLGVRLKVFCASMADVFDKGAPYELRVRLWKLIRATPSLDWLLLTKRPENFEIYLPWMPCPTDVCKYGALSGITCPGDDNGAHCDIEDGVGRSHDGALPDSEYRLLGERTTLAIQNTREPWPNVWLGVTAEDQKHANRRIPKLLATPAAIRFVSYEPALEQVDFRKYVEIGSACECAADSPSNERCEGNGPRGWIRCNAGLRHLDWIICGAESGPKARLFHEGWARVVRDQCAAAGVPFFYKQRVDGLLKIGRPFLDGRQHVEQPR